VADASSVKPVQDRFVTKPGDDATLPVKSTKTAEATPVPTGSAAPAK
jgi:hypothetical protein